MVVTGSEGQIGSDLKLPETRFDIFQKPPDINPVGPHSGDESYPSQTPTDCQEVGVGDENPGGATQQHGCLDENFRPANQSGL